MRQGLARPDRGNFLKDPLVGEAVERHPRIPVVLELRVRIVEGALDENEDAKQQRLLQKNSRPAGAGGVECDPRLKTLRLGTEIDAGFPLWTGGPSRSDRRPAKDRNDERLDPRAPRRGELKPLQGLSPRSDEDA